MTWKIAPLQNNARVEERERGREGEREREKEGKILQENKRPRQVRTGLLLILKCELSTTEYICPSNAACPSGKWTNDASLRASCVWPACKRPFTVNQVLICFSVITLTAAASCLLLHGRLPAASAELVVIPVSAEAHDAGTGTDIDFWGRAESGPGVS